MTTTSALPTARPLPAAAPSQRGVDAAGVLALVDALEADPRTEPHSLVVVRGGAVVAQGWWAPYAADRPHLLYSVSKSFTATALGLAVAEGLVGLDDPVVSHFPELDAEITDPRSRAVLVRHVAAMASGHVTDMKDAAEASDPTDLVRGFLLNPPPREPGSVFAYDQPCTYAVAAIVARASGQSLTQYLRPRLLDPLGIGEVGWQRDASGRDLGYSGLHAPTDAVAKLALLHARRGEWEGAQLLDPAWVDTATAVQVPTVDPLGQTEPVTGDSALGYGFQFWRSRHGYRADGAYGQFGLVLPEHDAVVAYTGAAEHGQLVLDAVWEHLLPALGGPRGDGGSDPAGSAEADAALAERLGSLQLPLVTGRAVPAAPAPGVTAALADVREGAAGAAWTISVTDAAATLVAPVGEGRWELSAPAGPTGPVPLAVSGLRRPGGGADVDVVFLETPHRLHVAVAADGSSSAGWATVPLRASALHELRSPAPSRR